MKKILFVITLCLVSANVQAQSPRPQWNSHYNGRGFTPGYSYNPRSGWNTMTSPGGNMMHYRDGYVPMQPSAPRSNGQRYSSGSGYYKNGPGYGFDPSPRPRYKSKYRSTSPMPTYSDMLNGLGGP